MNETNNTQMENQSNTEQTALATPPEVKEQQETEKTFTRDELNKMIAAEQRKASAAAKLEAAAEYQRQQEEEKTRQTEAEKFSKLQADEQVKELQCKLDEAESAKAELKQEHEAYQLKQLAIEKASKAELPLSLINDLDYRNVSAESLDGLISDRLTEFNSEVEKRVNKRLGQNAPTTVVGGSTSPNAALQTRLDNARKARNSAEMSTCFRLAAEQGVTLK